MALDEIPDALRKVAPLEIAPPAQLAGDILRNVSGPTLRSIEANDLNWIIVLAAERCLRFPGSSHVGFMPDPAEIVRAIAL
jgi:hypothetical protein